MGGERGGGDIGPDCKRKEIMFKQFKSLIYLSSYKFHSTGL